jgi:uncharacterized protein
MPTYLSPGVFVEEVPSSIKPIAGVSTSTAGFIGVVPDKLDQPLAGRLNVLLGLGDGSTLIFNLPTYPTAAATANLRVDVKVDGAAQPAAAFQVSDDDPNKVSKITFTSAPAKGSKVTANIVPINFATTPAGVPQLCTNFSGFKKLFGDFSTDAHQAYLAQAVYGFFNNGGSRCFVMRVAQEADIPASLPKFEAIDEIAIVAAPGLAGNDTVGKNTRAALIDQCKNKTHNRFAIFDTTDPMDQTPIPDLTTLDPHSATNKLPPVTDIAAFYFPWIQVFDPISGNGVNMPPAGHVAGIYSRVDTQRGVHKAPANEPVMGALDVTYPVSKSQQDGLNPQGVNCIRNLTGNITVWGARTLGGDANADLKYINVRRTLLFLRDSIDQGTQWVVFEPNDPSLWQKITRNVSAFLRTVWRSGALFGDTEAQAFYVKCDAETNPPELRDLGQVVTEVGVAIVRPAEFVVFRISQFTAPGS